MKIKIWMFCFVIIIGCVFVSGKYSMDILLDKDAYSVGDNLVFIVRLLENGIPVSREVNTQFSDILNNKKISMVVMSNEENSLLISNDFPSGYWNVEAFYGNETTKKSFLINEDMDAEFSIENDTLIIKNTGNVRYTRTIYITIGNVTKSYAQDIKVGGEKRLKLISPKGRYDIKVHDGEKSFIKKDVQLFGTGKVVGALDEGLIGYSGFAGVANPANIENRLFPKNRLRTALIFVASVVVLLILLFINKKVKGKK